MLVIPVDSLLLQTSRAVISIDILYIKKLDAHYCFDCVVKSFRVSSASFPFCTLYLDQFFRKQSYIATITSLGSLVRTYFFIFISFDLKVANKLEVERDTPLLILCLRVERTTRNTNDFVPDDTYDPTKILSTRTFKLLVGQHVFRNGSIALF